MSATTFSSAVRSCRTHVDRYSLYCARSRLGSLSGSGGSSSVESRGSAIGAGGGGATAGGGGGGGAGGGGAGAQREVLVSTDLYGGHFRAGNPQQRAEQRAFELGFVLDALEVEVEEEDRDDAAPGT